MMRALVTTLLISFVFDSQGFANDERGIHVLGHGEIRVEPDMARLSMAVTLVDKNVLKAKKIVDTAVLAVLEVAKKLDIAEEDVTATQLQVSAQYNYENNKHELVGYETTRSVSIVLRKLNKLDALLTGCIEAGVNQVDRIELQSSKEKALKDQALKLAIENAKQLAVSTAAGFDAKVGKVQKIAAERGPIAMSLSTPVEGLAAVNYKPGKIEISADIDVIFQLD